MSRQVRPAVWYGCPCTGGASEHMRGWVAGQAPALHRRWVCQCGMPALQIWQVRHRWPAAAVRSDQARNAAGSHLHRQRALPALWVPNPQRRISLAAACHHRLAVGREPAAGDRAAVPGEHLHVLGGGTAAVLCCAGSPAVLVPT